MLSDVNAWSLCQSQTTREGCMATYPRETLLFVPEMAELRHDAGADDVSRHQALLEQATKTIDLKQSCTWTSRGSASGSNSNAGTCSYKPLKF